jgi:hypothetical protein
MPSHLQHLVVVSMFAACAAMVIMWGEHTPANEIMQLMLLAGVIITYLDNQQKARQTSQQIAENTELTAKAERSLNGAAEERIRIASQAAYAKGQLDGQEQERTRQQTMKGSTK